MKSETLWAGQNTNLDRGLSIHLSRFEGPMSLLLYLIKKEEMNIYDIPIHEITKQYLEYIQIMKELNLEVAGEFISMAATLIYIKSRMLVPQYNEHGIESDEDPRQELVAKLLEYQKFQEAGKELYKRPLLGRDVWLRGAKEPWPQVEEEFALDDKGLFALIGVFRQLMKEAKKSPHQIAGKGLSISAKLMEIKDQFKVGEQIEIKSLLPQDFTRLDLIITFLSILELSRLKFIRIYQTEALSPLYLETLKPVTADVVSTVEQFDGADHSRVADQIMAQAEGESET